MIDGCRSPVHTITGRSATTRTWISFDGGPLPPSPSKASPAEARVKGLAATLTALMRESVSGSADPVSMSNRVTVVSGSSARMPAAPTNSRKNGNQQPS